MSKLFELKKYLKVKSAEIRVLRVKLKECQKKFSGCDDRKYFDDDEYFEIKNEIRKMYFEIKKISRDYRHYHIAYCLIRGRRYEQIEKSFVEGNQPNMVYIQEIKDAYKEDVCVSAQ